MCGRVRCLAAVNAEFALPGLDEPTGGMVVDGVVVRSAVPTHHEVMVSDDGALSTGQLQVVGRLVSTDLETVAIDSVNRSRGPDQVVLYTPTFADTTQTNDHGVEVVVRGTAGPIARASRTALVELVELRTGAAAPIPADGAVLSGHGRGATALTALWERAQAGTVSREVMLRLDVAPGAAQAVGGTPVLVREGARYVSTSGNEFVTGRHPRTIVGWTADGEVLLATIDGRQPGYSEGLSLPEAADLMIQLGAVEALNLDGGGSTTFAVHGDVVNRPSDQLVRRAGRELVVPVPRSGDVVLGNIERPVVSALAVVATKPAAEAAPGAVAPPRPADDRRAVLYIAAADPASVPQGGLAVLAASRPPPRSVQSVVTLAAAMLVIVTALATAFAVNGRRRTLS